MENALYYTLSTVAQTLAGALAVLVAFVVVRLGRLDDIIGHGEATLRSKGGPTDEALRILLDQGPEAMDVFYKEKTSNTLKVGGGWEAYTPAYQAGRDRPIIKQRLYVALGFTVAAIVVCFIALPLTPWITCSRLAIGSTVFMAVGLGLLNLGLYVWLIRAIVGRVKDPAVSPGA